MECNTARMLAELRGNRDTELPPEDDASLDQHLRSCPECRSAIRLERQIDERFARAMQSVPVPPRLKSQILERLATERGAFYRRRIFAVTAAAAAVMVAVGLLTWNLPSKARFDVNQLAIDVDRFSGKGKGDAVNAWLAGHGIAYDPPVQFDPQWLAFHGMTEIQGKQVPTLLYHNAERNVYAQVYILRDSDFEAPDLQVNSGGSAGIYRWKIEVVKDRAHRDGLTYVILYDGDSLEPFRKKFFST